MIALCKENCAALERTLNAGFLCVVQRTRLVTGITAGIIPAAATTGMLFGYGIRLGQPTLVFQAIGAIGGGMTSTPRVGALLGLLLHIVATLACGVLYVALTGESRDNRFAWAIAIGAAAAAAAFVAARTFGGSIALVLTPGNLVTLGVVIAITLPIGMRFAPSTV